MSGAAGFEPHVSPYEQPPELTLRAVLLGSVLGIVFGASSTYLALRIGLTVSASVPIAVIAIALLRQRHGQRAILEHNITQTVGSAGGGGGGGGAGSAAGGGFFRWPPGGGLRTHIAPPGGRGWAPGEGV